MKLKKAFFAGLVALSPVGLMAQEAVSIPETGVDIAGYITSAITALGGVVAVAVGGYFAFLGIKAALKWGRTATR